MMSVERQLRRRLQATPAMERFLDDLFGPGLWQYDPTEDVWVAPDRDYRGSGRGYIVVKRGGAWFKSVIPASTAMT